MSKIKKPELELVVENEPVVRTITDNDVRMVCQSMGDSLSTRYASTGDIKDATAAISAYGAAINIVKIQLLYKKMMNSPARIDFFEIGN